MRAEFLLPGCERGGRRRRVAAESRRKREGRSEYERKGEVRRVKRTRERETW